MNYKENFKEGIYHEIGHALATIVEYEDDNRLSSIKMKKKDNGSYGFVTNWNSGPLLKDKNELLSLTVVAFAGSVFQQMISCYSSYVKGRLCFNLIERLVSLFNKKHALQMFFERHVAERNEGMLQDLALITVVYEKYQEAGFIKHQLNELKAKNDTIKVLLPFVEATEIHELADYCLKVFWYCGMAGGSEAEVDANTIKEFLGNLFKGK